jgi:hypothetical protein
MDDVNNDFYEDDEPADKIHQLFETATEKGLTERRPLPFGAVDVVCWTVGVARSPIEPGTAFKVEINRVPAGV